MTLWTEWRGIRENIERFERWDFEEISKRETEREKRGKRVTASDLSLSLKQWGIKERERKKESSFILHANRQAYQCVMWSFFIISAHLLSCPYSLPKWHYRPKGRPDCSTDLPITSYCFFAQLTRTSTTFFYYNHIKSPMFLFFFFF